MKSKVSMDGYSYEYVFRPNDTDLADKAMALKEVMDEATSLKAQIASASETPIKDMDICIKMSLLRYEVYKQFGLITADENFVELFYDRFSVCPKKEISNDQIEVK